MTSLRRARGVSSLGRLISRKPSRAGGLLVEADHVPEAIEPIRSQAGDRVGPEAAGDEATALGR